MGLKYKLTKLKLFRCYGLGENHVKNIILIFFFYLSPYFLFHSCMHCHYDWYHYIA